MNKSIFLQCTMDNQKQPLHLEYEKQKKHASDEKKRGAGIIIEDFGVHWVRGVCGNSHRFFCGYGMGMEIEIQFPRQPGLLHNIHLSSQETWWQTQMKKKFELLLTRRVKAYSSSCSQTVSLSPAISSRLLRGTAI